jgi:integrase
MAPSEYLSAALLIIGGSFFLAGTLGLLRFPDVYTRLHALTKADNVGLGLIVTGLALQAASWTIAVKEFKSPPRQRYVTDGEYLFVLERAQRSGSPYLANIMELAYLCRMRLAEVLDIQQDQITKDGLLVRRRKGSKDNLVAWNDRLRAAISPPQRHYTRWLLAKSDGDRMLETTVQTAWQRLMRQAADAGLREKFTIHDLKRKGVTDTTENKLAASDNRSESMLKVYGVLPAEVKTADFGRKSGRKSD